MVGLLYISQGTGEILAPEWGKKKLFSEGNL